MQQYNLDKIKCEITYKEKFVDNKDLTEIEKKLGVEWKNKCINRYGW